MKFSIRSRWTNAVKVEVEISCAEDAPQSVQKGLAVVEALKSDADLSGANLSDADLSGANLSDADLSGANLSGANLSGANLSRADLSRADLSDANLSRADLSRADLSRADLSRADLSDADLSDANLSDANLSGARNDLWDVLLRARAEVPGLLAALRSGRVNGSAYHGECACLVGTIANIRHAGIEELGSGLKPDAARPAERWFLGIREGDTPETSQIAKVTEGWILEFLALTAVPVGNAA